MSRLGESWDNDDVRVRPTRSTRPRTKNRPRHSDALTGFVVTVDRGRYTCLVSGGTRQERVVTAMRARELGRRAVAVGDTVELVGETDGGADSLARIVRIGDRRSVLRRSADDSAEAGAGPGGEKILVANADQLVVVAAVTEPEPRPGFVDRCLVAAYTGDLDPVLVMTKTDLADPTPFAGAYAALDLPVLTVGRAAGRELGAADLAAIGDLVSDRVSVLVGHSGVGKSTLVNALVPEADRATGGVSGVGKGRHTSTSAIALRLPGGGWIIDTPGVRSFGLAHVTPDDLLETFDDLLPGTVDCPPGCDHSGSDGGEGSTGAGCALDSWVERGHATAERLASFRRLLASRGTTDY